MKNRNLWLAGLILLVIALTTGCPGDAPNKNELLRRANMEEALKDIPLPATALTETNVWLIVSADEGREQLLIEHFDTEAHRVWVPRDALAQQVIGLVPNTDALGVQQILFRYWQYRTQFMNK